MKATSMDGGTKYAILLIMVLGLALSLGCATPPCEQSGDGTRPAELGPLLDEDAALRAASAFGMETGLAEWTADLTEDRQHGVVWRVTNTTCDQADSGGGQVFVIDAHTGALLDTLRWGWLSFTGDDPGPPRWTPGESAEQPEESGTEP